MALSFSISQFRQPFHITNAVNAWKKIAWTRVMAMARAPRRQHECNRLHLSTGIVTWDPRCTFFIGTRLENEIKFGTAEYELSMQFLLLQIILDFSVRQKILSENVNMYIGSHRVANHWHKSGRWKFYFSGSFYQSLCIIINIFEIDIFHKSYESFHVKWADHGTRPLQIWLKFCTRIYMTKMRNFENFWTPRPPPPPWGLF